MARKRKRTSSTPSPTHPPQNPVTRPERQHQMRDRISVARMRRDTPRRFGVLVRDFFQTEKPNLREVEDLRRIPHAHKQGRYLHFDGTPARTGYKPVQNRVFGMFQGMHLGFLQPQKTLVCVRRKTRRRILFALQKVGRGRGAKRPRRARWTSKSYIRCK